MPTTNQKLLPTHTLVAVDVAKREVVVHAEAWQGRFDMTAAGLGKLVAQLVLLPNVFVVAEASGGYERPLIEALHKASIPIALVQPFRVRAFAKSKGVRAKTDPIDAAMIFAFARQNEITATPPTTPLEAALEAWLDRRQHRLEELTREKNRLDKVPALLLPEIKASVRYLEKQLALLEKKIAALIASDPALTARLEVMQTVCGVGPVTAWMVAIHLPELTKLNRRESATLAGLAPFNADSGQKIGIRKIHGGRARVRRALFNAARVAAQHNPVIKSYVAGLIARGKPYKSALVAAMRKLLIHLRSLLKNHELSLAS